jgi:hypothetical protein
MLWLSIAGDEEKGKSYSAKESKGGGEFGPKPTGWGSSGPGQMYSMHSGLAYSIDLPFPLADAVALSWIRKYHPSHTRQGMQGWGEIEPGVIGPTK